MAQALAKDMAREYETILILPPNATQDNIDKVASLTLSTIEKMEGKLLKAENWGVRKLAYPIKKKSKGLYIYLHYLGFPGLVHEMERYFRTIEAVSKFLTVKIDEDVDPAARPVAESDISFVNPFGDMDEEEAAKEAAKEEAKEEATEEASEDKAEAKAEAKAAVKEEAPKEEAAEAKEETTAPDSDAEAKSEDKADAEADKE